MTLAWYVLRSKPYKEEFSWGQLMAHQIEVYYPSIQARAFSPTTHKAKPYFPSYLFIHVDLQEYEPSFFEWMPGARGLVSFDTLPARVPDDVIAAIRRRVDRINQTVDESLPVLLPAGNAAIPEDPFARHAAIFETCRSGLERVQILNKLLRDIKLPLESPVA